MICSTDNLAPSKELVSFAERQVRNAVRYSGFERRSEKRNFMVIPVLAVPVDEQFNPIGDCVAVVTRDITSEGIGLVHPQCALGDRLALQMPLAGEEVNVVVKIEWCKPLGPYELSGGRFVARLDSFPHERPSCRFTKG